jgi:hypothetical protein
MSLPAEDDFFLGGMYAYLGRSISPGVEAED